MWHNGLKTFVLILTQQLFMKYFVNSQTIYQIEKCFKNIFGGNAVEILIPTYFLWIVMLDALLTLRRCTSACADLSTFDRSWGISTKCLVPLDKLLTWSLVKKVQKFWVRFHFELFSKDFKQELEQTLSSIIQVFILGNIHKSRPTIFDEFWPLIPPIVPFHTF